MLGKVAWVNFASFLNMISCRGSAVSKAFLVGETRLGTDIVQNI